MKVMYQTHMGDDLMVVNAARTSLDKQSRWQYKNGGTGKEYGCALEQALDEVESYERVEQYLLAEDAALINFLARGMTKKERHVIMEECIDKIQANVDGYPGDMIPILETVFEKMDVEEHWTPFGHPTIQLHLSIPFAVWNQLRRHQVGFVVSEVSRRYVDSLPNIYIPTLRQRVKSIKQGSGEEITDWRQRHYQDLLTEHFTRGVTLYKQMLEDEIAPESARFVLPESTYTEIVWTGTLYGWARVCKHRLDSHAQRETSIVAAQIADIISPLFPVSWNALMNKWRV